MVGEYYPPMVNRYYPPMVHRYYPPMILSVHYPPMVLSVHYPPMVHPVLYPPMVPLSSTAHGPQVLTCRTWSSGVNMPHMVLRLTPEESDGAETIGVYTEF